MLFSVLVHDYHNGIFAIASMFLALRIGSAQPPQRGGRVSVSSEHYYLVVPEKA